MNAKSPHIHFDEGPIETMLATMTAERAAQIDLPGYPGAQTRFNGACMGPFVLTMAREINRGTNAKDLHRAVAGVLANLAVSYVFSCTPNATDDERREIFDALARTLTNCALEALSTPEETRFVRPTPAGQA